MINRELIRIKTVQLLYSYLLIENPFSLESQPSAPTKEKRFAYSLYLDLLYLFTRLASKVDRRNGYPLADTRFIRAIKLDDRLKSLGAKYAGQPIPFAASEEELATKIKESAIYRNFMKTRTDDYLDENVWKEIFDLIILTDPAVSAEISRRENYTLKGVDRMRSIMETTFSNFFASADNIHDALKILKFSMEKTRELYFRLLALPIAITSLREREIDNARYKLLKNEEDLNPNLRFVDNEYVKFLRTDPDLQKAIEDYKIDWLSEDESLVKGLFRMISQSDIYKEYLEFPVTDFKTDCEFWRNVYRNLIFTDTSFLESIEDRSVFWNDDIDVIGTFILKSIRRLASAGEEGEAREGFVLPMFKDEEDAEFGAALFSEVIRRKDFYRGLILEHVDKQQWEIDRLAFMDSVITMAALAEIITCPKVPLQVTFNEYIEIAKYYSTPRSGVFVNGLMGRIVSALQENGKIHKTFNQ